VIAVLLALAACDKPAEEAAKPADCASLPPVDWDGFAAGFFRSYCTACHSAATVERRGAPEGVDFDTEGKVREQAARIRARVLEDATMPVGGGVPDDDLALLAIYLDCGT
jgi:uncharacterized membrane protein